MTAGRIMLARIHGLVARGQSFAFETTLWTGHSATLFRGESPVQYTVTFPAWYRWRHS